MLYLLFSIAFSLHSVTQLAFLIFSLYFTLSLALYFLFFHTPLFSLYFHTPLSLLIISLSSYFTFLTVLFSTLLLFNFMTLLPLSISLFYFLFTFSVHFLSKLLTLTISPNFLTPFSLDLLRWLSLFTSCSTLSLHFLSLLHTPLPPSILLLYFLIQLFFIVEANKPWKNHSFPRHSLLRWSTNEGRDLQFDSIPSPIPFPPSLHSAYRAWPYNFHDIPVESKSWFCPW